MIEFPKCYQHIIIFILLMVPALGSQVFVGNQPYKGAVTSLGQEIRFQLQELAEALDLQAEERNGKWTLSGLSVQTSIKDGVVLIELKDLPSELIRVIRNKEVGTIDLYAVTEEGEPRSESWGLEGKLVYFYADWSDACQAMTPTLNSINASRLISVQFLNIEEPDSRVYRKYHRLFKGDIIPYFVILNSKDRKVESFGGFQNYPELIDRLNGALAE